MMKIPDDIIGVGLYTPSEAARYANISPQKFSRWVFGTARAKPVIDPQLGRNGDRIATFLDLAQSLSIHDVRVGVEIPLQKLREAYLRAKEMYKVQYPFAMKHGAFLFGDLSTKQGRRRCEIGIFVEKPGIGPQTAEELRDAICVQFTGKKRDNLLMKPIVQQFSKKLRFGEEGIASEYEVFNAHGHRILIDPDVRFGQPYIESIGYEAFTLFNAARIEKTVDRAARVYRVPKSAVQAAVAYIRSIGGMLLNTNAA